MNSTKANCEKWQSFIHKAKLKSLKIFRIIWAVIITLRHLNRHNLGLQKASVEVVEKQMEDYLIFL